MAGPNPKGSDGSISAWTGVELSQYNTAAATEKAAILANTSLDSISKQELINQLGQGDAAITAANTDNEATLDRVAQDDLNNVSAQIEEDESDDPLYLGRRYLEQQYLQAQNEPGRAQTVLTSRTNTAAGTPSLITSGPGGTQNNIDLTTPGTILTGKT
jgi:hypothetical protein